MVVTVVMHIRCRLCDDRFYVGRVRDLVTNLARKLHWFEREPIPTSSCT